MSFVVFIYQFNVIHFLLLHSLSIDYEDSKSFERSNNYPTPVHGVVGG